MLETFQPEVRGSNLASKMTLLMARSGLGAMANSDMQETLSAPPYYLMQIKTLEGHGTQCLGSPMSTNMRDEVV